MREELRNSECRTDGFQKELNQSLMHLQEVRDQIKTMQVDKSSLLQDNTMHEMKIKNLLEELKLT